MDSKDLLNAQKDRMDKVIKAQLVSMSKGSGAKIDVHALKREIPGQLNALNDLCKSIQLNSEYTKRTGQIQPDLMMMLGDERGYAMGIDLLKNKVLDMKPLRDRALDSQRTMIAMKNQMIAIQR